MISGNDITRHRYYIYNNGGQLTYRTLPGNMTYSYTYAVNGNILSKTGLGSYEYGSSSRPHAVTAVDDTDDMLAVYEQEDSQNGTWTDVVAAMTDHLGSITCLMDDFDYKASRFNA